MPLRALYALIWPYKAPQGPCGAHKDCICPQPPVLHMAQSRASPRPTVAAAARRGRHLKQSSSQEWLDTGPWKTKWLEGLGFPYMAWAFLRDFMAGQGDNKGIIRAIARYLGSFESLIFLIKAFFSLESNGA